MKLSEIAIAARQSYPHIKEGKDTFYDYEGETLASACVLGFCILELSFGEPIPMTCSRAEEVFGISTRQIRAIFDANDGRGFDAALRVLSHIEIEDVEEVRKRLDEFRSPV